VFVVVLVVDWDFYEHHTIEPKMDYYYYYYYYYYSYYFFQPPAKGKEKEIARIFPSMPDFLRKVGAEEVGVEELGSVTSYAILLY